MPAAVLRAAVATALLWNWPRVAAMLLLGFTAMLRPCEFLSASREDLILPVDLLDDTPVAHLRIATPKSKSRCPRQRTVVSDAIVARLLSATYTNSLPNELLFGGSEAVFRKRWDAIFSRLGFSVAQQPRGLTPASLRGSGAALFFHRAEDLLRITWRGRWGSQKTLRHYLQDVAGQMFLRDLSTDQRRLIVYLSALCSRLLAERLG